MSLLILYLKINVCLKLMLFLPSLPHQTSYHTKSYNIYTRCDQKITVILKFPKLLMFDFRILFSYVRTHVCYIYLDNISHFGLSVCFLTDKKFSRVLVCSSIFYYSKKQSEIGAVGDTKKHISEVFRELEKTLA